MNPFGISNGEEFVILGLLAGIFLIAVGSSAYLLSVIANWKSYWLDKVFIIVARFAGFFTTIGGIMVIGRTFEAAQRMGF